MRIYSHALLTAALAISLVSSTATLDRGGLPDEPRGTVVVSNMNDNTATVLDAATGRVLATLPTGEAPHEVAAARGGRWAVVTNYGVRERPGHTITVIDLERLDVARTIDLGRYQRPHGVAFLPGDTLLAVTSEVSRVVLLVGFGDGRVIDTIPTNGRGSHMLATSVRADQLFTTNVPDGSITQVDLGGRVARRVIPVAKFVEGITVMPDGSAAWVGSNGDSLVAVVDTRAGQVTDTVRGFGLPYRLAASPNGELVAVTDPVHGEVRVFDARTTRQRFAIAVPRDSIVQTAEVPGSPSPEGITISPDSRWAFVTLQGRNRVITIDLQRGAIVRYAPTGTWSDGIAFSPTVSPAR